MAGDVVLQRPQVPWDDWAAGPLGTTFPGVGAKGESSFSFYYSPRQEGGLSDAGVCRMASWDL